MCHFSFWRIEAQNHRAKWRAIYNWFMILQKHQAQHTRTHARTQICWSHWEKKIDEHIVNLIIVVPSIRRKKLTNKNRKIKENSQNITIVRRKVLNKIFFTLHSIFMCSVHACLFGQLVSRLVDWLCLDSLCECVRLRFVFIKLLICLS